MSGTEENLMDETISLSELEWAVKISKKVQMDTHASSTITSFTIS